MSSRYVVDSFAWIALLQRESGWEIMHELFKKAEADKVSLYMSLINFGEIVYLIERRLGLPAAHQFLGKAKVAPIELVPATYQRVIEAAHIKASYPMSYADAFATALAQEFDATILTGDPEFRAVEHLIELHWLDDC